MLKKVLIGATAVSCISIITFIALIHQSSCELIPIEFELDDIEDLYF